MINDGNETTDETTAANAVTSIVDTLPAKDQKIIRAIEFDLYKGLTAVAGLGGVLVASGLLVNNPKVWIIGGVQAGVGFLAALVGKSHGA